MKKSAFLLLGLPLVAQANDSTGYLSTGGVEYIKNDKIAMQSEDLFISQNKIRVAYQYKNLTDQDVTENILFPLPIVNNSMLESSFADTEGLVESFKIVANGKTVKPTVHLRAVLYPFQNGVFSEQPEDVTEIFKACGLSEQDISSIWSKHSEVEAVEEKILACKDERLTKLQQSKDPLMWGAQIIYSWEQTFKANAITAIEHEYKPLVGGGISQDIALDKQFDQSYCLDSAFHNAMKSLKNTNQTYDELSYILTTGANWAKPIGNFRLTVERNADDLVAFCWNGEVKKVFDNGKVVRFEAIQKDFTPKNDLDVLFVN